MIIKVTYKIQHPKLLKKGVTVENIEFFNPTILSSTNHFTFQKSGYVWINEFVAIIDTENVTKSENYLSMMGDWPEMIQRPFLVKRFPQFFRKEKLEKL